MSTRHGTLRYVPGAASALLFAYHREARKDKRGRVRRAGEVTQPVLDWGSLSAEVIERASAADDPLATLDGSAVRAEVVQNAATEIHAVEAAGYKAPDPEQVAALQARSPLQTAETTSGPTAAERRAAERKRRGELEQAEQQEQVRQARQAIDRELEAQRRAREATDRQRKAPRRTTATRQFHNPYNFVPAPPRPTAGGAVPLGQGLGDGPPLGHDRFAPGAWSGRLSVKLTVLTPLLISHHGQRGLTRVDDERHRFHDLRTTPEGDPDLDPTALKGMLRSYFEAATNSRMGVFGHRGPLTRRLAYGEGLEAVRVTLDDAGALRIERCERVRLRHYEGEGENRREPLAYVDGSRPSHGDAVKVQVSGSGETAIARRIERIPDDPVPGRREGWVLVTGKPKGRSTNKVNEAVLIATEQTLESSDDDDLVERWKAVVQSYLDALEQPAAIETTGDHQRKDQLDLRRLASRPPGVLCYANVVGTEVHVLVPVRVGRIPFPRRPIDALDHTLRPAATRQQLSPADRLCGWVGENEREPGSAHAGQLTVRGVQMTAEPPEGAIRNLRDEGEGGLPLAILSAPKPQQALFYAAADERGTAFGDGDIDGVRKTALTREVGLRGRKVYPHQRLAADHFAAPEPGREYRRAGDLRDSQNRSVLGWVRPGTEFSFDIDLMNVNDAELGALVWLLRRPEGRAFAFGGGRPLGFGSVTLGLQSAHLQTGEQIAAALRALSPSSAACAGPKPDDDLLDRLERDFLAAACELTDAPADELPLFLDALDRALCGPSDGLPTHYPRLEEHATEHGRNYKWFVDNLLASRGGAFALPGILEDTTALPRNPTL